MTEYRYLFADLLTDQVLAELPLTGVSFNKELNAIGSFSGRLLLGDGRSDVYSVEANTIPGRTALYVDRSGTLVWGGIVWGRAYSSVDQSIMFQAREFESYFEKRRITKTYVADNVDQLTVAKALIDAAQAVTSGNIGVSVPAVTSGVVISRTYSDFEQKPVYEAVQELSRANNGFDFNIDVAYDASMNFTKTMELAYPRRGVQFSLAATNVSVLEFPGNIVEYDYPEDGGSIANTMHGVGGGLGDGMLLSTQSNAAALAAGYAVLEQSVSLTDYQDQTLLDQITLGYLNSLLEPVVVMRVVTEAYNDPILGTFKTGDDIRLRITDPRFPDTFDEVRRIVRFDVQPGEEGPERVTFNLAITPSELTQTFSTDAARTTFIANSIASINTTVTNLRAVKDSSSVPIL